MGSDLKGLTCCVARTSRRAYSPGHARVLPLCLRMCCSLCVAGRLGSREPTVSAGHGLPPGSTQRGLDGQVRCPGVRSGADGSTGRCGNALSDGAKLCRTCSGYRRGTVTLVTDKPKEVRRVLGNYS